MACDGTIIRAEQLITTPLSSPIYRLFMPLPSHQINDASHGNTIPFFFLSLPFLSFRRVACSHDEYPKDKDDATVVGCPIASHVNQTGGSKYVYTKSESWKVMEEYMIKLVMQTILRTCCTQVNQCLPSLLFVLLFPRNRMGPSMYSCLRIAPGAEKSGLYLFGSLYVTSSEV